MRKPLMSALVAFGFMNLSYGQSSTTEKLTIQSFDEKGQVDLLQLEGKDALTFDIEDYITDNDHLDRIMINGFFKTDLNTTIVKFDSNTQDGEGDYVCQDVETRLTPFIGVATVGRDDLNGVDVKRIIQSSPASIAGINVNESITDFNGEVINSYCDLLSAVRSSEIGSRVEMKISKGSSQYSKYIVIGAKEINTITYTYCDDEPIENFVIANNIDEIHEASLSTYPNPTRSLSNVIFNSTSNEDVTLHIMDITGNLLHKDVYTNFSGSLRTDYTFEDIVDGTYYIVIQQGEETYKRQVQVIAQ